MHKITVGTIIVILTVTFIADVTLAQSAINIELTKSSCQTKTQVDAAILDKVRAGDYSIEDKKLQAYAYCIYRSLGAIDDDANLSVSSFKALVKQSLNDDKLQGAIDLCSKVTGSDVNEKAYRIVKCFYEQYPGDGDL